MQDRRVPYVQIAAQHVTIRNELLAAASRVIEHGQFVLGPEVAAFESAFAGLVGVKHAVGLNSGTDALTLALKCLNIGKGDEVITVPNTFVATVSAIRLAGATPVFVDVMDDGNMDPDRLDAAMSPRTRCIMPVHLMGRPVQMDRVMAVAARRGLSVVEDAAQAVGASFRGRPVGSIGTVGCFSLHPLKTLNACGDGGVVTTGDTELDSKLRVLRNIGLQSREDAVAWSGNSRLDTIQAAFLLVKLPRLKEWTESRRRNAEAYRRRLAGVAEVRLPPADGDSYCVYHTFVIKAERRDALKAFLEKHGVGTAIHYPVPVHLQSVGRELGYKKGCFPAAERQAGEILSLPIHQDLAEVDIDWVSQCIASFYGR